MCFGAAFPAALTAGPDETTNTLMNDSVSILDWGILRTELYLAQQNLIIPAQVSFDWDSNEIRISAWQFGGNDTTTEVQAKAVCSDWFFGVRVSGGISTETGEPYFSEVSTYANFFGHEGFVRNFDSIEYKALLAKLDRKIELSATILMDISKSDGLQSVKCSGPLLGVGFAVQENRETSGVGTAD